MGSPQHPSWLLAVDFGTSNTAAAYVSPESGRLMTLPLSHSGNLMPSAAFVSAPNQIEVGEVALNRAASDPSGYLSAPKRLITLGETVFRVGDWDIPAHHVVAAVLHSVLLRVKAQNRGQAPAGLVLTHPEGWSPQQIAVLTQAAGVVGYPAHTVTVVSEPQAAVHFYARGRAGAVGGHVAVFDFGGGTLDIAVLSSPSAGSFRVLGTHGDNALGGRNFDTAIRRWVDVVLDDRNPDLAAALLNAAAFHELRGLEESVRRAKELLSEAPSATVEVTVGGRREVLSLTRNEFEALILHDVERGVELARNVFRTARVAENIREIYLTGGSSRIPLVHKHVQALGAIATLDDPKTVVAQGALVAVARRMVGGSGPAAHYPATATPRPAPAP
ncbi:MAG: Hsp70 family protein, partial [Mycobacteriaceae bacterium]|nr:Hsp70 family protein [Mycobacteriaceae bacterium]